MAPSLNMSQQVRQAQQMLMAPQLLQSLEFLQAPVMELRTMIQREMEKNPVIEEVESGQEVSLDSTGAEATGAAAQEDLARGHAADDDPVEASASSLEGTPRAEQSDSPDSAEDSPQPPGDSEPEMMFNPDIPNYDWDDDSYREQVENESPSEEAEERRRFLFDSFTVEETMQESLVRQLLVADVPKAERDLAILLVGALDDDGYLRDTQQDLRLQTGADDASLAAAIACIQELDPAGVGARDLRECMLIQLDRRTATPESTLARRIVDSCFELLAKHKDDQIVRALKCTPGEFEAALAVIRSLDPRPGKSVGPSEATAVTPEVSVEWDAAAERFVVKADDALLPRIRLNRGYQAMYADPATPREAREYLRERLNSARNLASSLELRQRTIVRIAQVIVDTQQEFFEKGVEHLKPMTMADVAAQVIGREGNPMHETTVSRAVANKYLRMPDGRPLPLKYFFSTGLHTVGGADVSNKAIQDRIKAIIAGEDPAHPLSDQAIADMLNEKQDVQIARRTVAKYRENLNILSSSLRKRSLRDGQKPTDRTQQ